MTYFVLFQMANYNIKPFQKQKLESFGFKKKVKWK